jgi:hypothetical protein
VINTGKYNDGVHDPLGAEQFFRLAIAVAVTPIYLTVPMSHRHNINARLGAEIASAPTM